MQNRNAEIRNLSSPEWSKRPFWSKWPYSELDFSSRETKNSPFWTEEVHLGPPTVLWRFLIKIAAATPEARPILVRSGHVGRGAIANRKNRCDTCEVGVLLTLQKHKKN